MPIDLPRLARASGKRRNIVFRPIIPTSAQATDLAAILLPAVNIWALAKPRILAGYDPKPFTADSASDMQSAIDQTAAEFSRVVFALGLQTRQWVLRIERWHRAKWVGAALSATGIDLGTVLTSGVDPETVEAFVARNVALAKNISDQAQARISDSVFRGYQQRTPVREVAKEIDEAVGLGKQRARAIAQDQLSKLSAALDTERMADAGIEMWKYRHSGKLHPRSTHKARDGRIYDLKTNKQIDGPDQIASGDGPGEPPYCGCRKQSYIRLIEELD